MRSDNYSHQWETCRRPALSAGTKTGNHLPVLFQALQTVGNRENVWTLPEYSRVSNPQDVKAPAERNGRCFHLGNPNLIPYETIVRATSGEPEAVDEVLRHYSRQIRLAALENGHVNPDTEDSIKSRLVAALLKFRFDEHEA